MKSRDIVDNRPNTGLEGRCAEQTKARSIRCLQSPFPLLTTLCLLSATCAFHKSSVSTLTWDIPNMMPLVFPALRFLDLDMVCIQWSSGIFENLVCLRLHRQWIAKIPQRRTRDGGVCALTGKMPALECLDLRYAVPGSHMEPRFTPIQSKSPISRLSENSEWKTKLSTSVHMLGHLSYPLCRLSASEQRGTSRIKSQATTW